MEEKITPLTEFERELISRSAAFVAQGIVKNFQFSSRDVLRLIATVEDAEARAKKNADDLRRASGLAINANFRAEKAEAEVARLKIKSGEKAPDGTCILYFVPVGQALCPRCERGIASPWDEPGMHWDNSKGWHGIITCHNCSSKIEVHSQHKHFWTARIAEETTSRAVEGK